MPKYSVTICRIGYGFHDIEVEAGAQVAAEAKAHSEAGNHTYREKDAYYEVEHSSKVE